MFKKFIQENFSIKGFFLLLKTASLLSFLWVFAGFTVQYFTYLKQGNTSRAEVFDWGIIEMSNTKYLVCADFRFQTDGMEEFVSQHIFNSMPFLSHSAAEIGMEDLKQKEWHCYWYGSAKNPIVSMERDFPFKSMFYSITALGVYVYFVFFTRKKLLLVEDSI